MITLLLQNTRDPVGYDSSSGTDATQLNIAAVNIYYCDQDLSVIVVTREDVDQELMVQLATVNNEHDFEITVITDEYDELNHPQIEVTDEDVENYLWIAIERTDEVRQQDFQMVGFGDQNIPAVGMIDTGIASTIGITNEHIEHEHVMMDLTNYDDEQY